MSYEGAPSGMPDLGDVRHWWGMSPEGCEEWTWLPFVEAVVIGMKPKRKLTMTHPSQCPGASRTP